MEIKVLEKFEQLKDSVKVYDELNKLICGKEISLFEYNEDNKNYDFVDDYKIESLQLWEDDQIVFTFGDDEWDICSINKTDLIKIKNENSL